MKKTVLLICSLFTITIYSQISPFESKPLKSPESTAFVNANFLPLDEYTGKAGITIPLYSINLDGLEIPISLTYDTGGVKVNATSSNVGLNWTLNTGGLINKETRGSSDIGSNFIMNAEYSTLGGAYIQYGFLKHLISYPVMNPVYPIAIAGIDNQPDKFFVVAPGLSTEFVHRYDGTPLEISKQNNIINSPFTDSRFLYEPFLGVNISQFQLYSNLFFRNENGFTFGFKIINTKGYEYSFYDVEKSILFFKNYDKVNTPLDVNSTPFDPLTIDIKNEDYPYQKSPTLGSISTDAYPTIKLSKIKNPISRREVVFEYEENNIVDNNRHLDFYSYSLENNWNNGDKTVVYDHDIIVEKLLKSIAFPDGRILFYYDSNRLDLRGGKVLKKIEVRNNDGILIKGVTFEQSYFAGISGCNDSFYCKRLRLDAISFFDKNNVKLPGYSFQYSSLPLPKRNAVDQDYLGFYNGPSNISTLDYIPKIYFKANQGKLSYLPFPYTGYALVGNGNGSKVPNLIYGRAGCLDKITYPTGGYTLFDYELNTFDLLGINVSCGGLRLSQQSFFDSQGLPQKKLNYSYNYNSGITSGRILNLPNFISESFSGESFKTIYQNYNNRLELNNSSSFVGYSQVKITEENNGYNIKKYSNIADSPNIYPTPPTVLINPYNSNNYDLYYSKLNNGLLPSLFKDFSMKRGNLLSSEIFSNNNTLLKSVFNEYNYTKYDEIIVSQNYTIVNRSPYVLNSEVYAKFDSSIDVQSNVLSKTSTNEYSASGQITNTTLFNYYIDKPFLNEKTTTNLYGNILKQKYYYPFDISVSGLANVAALNTLNILKPIKEVSLIDNEILSTSANSYQNLGNNKIVPLDLQQSKGINSLNIIETYNKYDTKGNLVEYAKKDGIPNTILYGYNYEYKIAEIAGADYNQVLTALGIMNIDVLQGKTIIELETIFNTLRTTLPNSQIYSYTHIPLVGVNSITDPRGLTNYMEYDSFNRLIKTKDNNQNIVGDQKYNYAIIPNAVAIFQENLSMSIEKTPTIDYVPYTSSTVFKQLLTAKVRGGMGNYNYEWRIANSTAVLSRFANYIASISCGTSLALTVTVTDGALNSIVQNITVNAANCIEPFYVGAIEGTSGVNNQYSFWVNPEGGSYRYKYTWWFVGTITTQGGSTTTTNYCPRFLINTASSAYTGTLYVEIKDLESGYIVQRNRLFTIYPQSQPTGSCFIAGTKITMSDGTYKSIEDVRVGDNIMTYNVDKQKIETGSVEKIVTPTHNQLVELNFENNIVNTNTLDHPYYVKNKGWSSYDPKFTLSNYGLKVNKYEEGDTVLYYDNDNKTINEIQIKKLKLVTKEQKTYNLQKVSKNHDFFANGVLVHNKSIK